MHKSSKKKKRLSFFHRKKYKEEKMPSANGSVETGKHFTLHMLTLTCQAEAVANPIDQ